MKGRHDLSRNCHTYNDELLLVRKHNVCTTLSLARKLFAEYMNDDWQMPAYNLIKTEVKIENWISNLKSPKDIVFVTLSQGHLPFHAFTYLHL